MFLKILYAFPPMELIRIEHCFDTSVFEIFVCKKVMFHAFNVLHPVITIEGVECQKKLPLR